MVKWKKILWEYRTSYLIAWAALLPIVMLVFDNEPPRFPLDTHERPVDCYNVRLAEMSLRSGRIYFEFETDEFTQYPRQIAPHLVTIETSLDPNTIRISSSGFAHFNTTVERFEFDIYPSIQGTLNVTAICHHRTLGSSKMNLFENISYLSGWSRMLPFPNCVAEFCDFCMNNNELVFSSINSGHINSFNLSKNVHIPVRIDARSMSTFQFAVPGTEFERGVSIIVEDNSESLGQYFSDVVLPVFLAQNGTESTVFVIGNSPFTGVSRVAERIVPFNIRDRVCFQSARFVRASTSTSPFGNMENITYIDYLLESLEMRVRELRDRFVSESDNRGLVICDSESGSVKPCVDISDISDVVAAAKVIARASEFIVSDQLTLQLTVFLRPGSTISTCNRSLAPAVTKFAKVLNCRAHIYNTESPLSS